MQDETIPAKTRLSYIPYGVYFIMTFADLNKYLLPNNVSGSPLETIITTHGEEDSKHWAWFLKDMETLGYNADLTFNDACSFIWSKEGLRTRMFCYKLAQHALNADPLMKIVIIEAIESMGKVWLTNTVQITKELGLDDKLIYLGQYHLDRELGHAMGSEEDVIDSIIIPAEMRPHAERVILELYDGMEGYNQDLVDRALKGHKLFKTKKYERSITDGVS